MAMISGTFGEILRNRRSVGDFMREAEEFEARKRQRQMQEQLGNLQIEAQKFDLEKAKRELEAPKMPFEGTSWDAQIANEAYNYNLQKGMDPDSAKRQAIDMVMGTKSTTETMKDPVTGAVTYVSRPRTGLFKSAGGAIDPLVANRNAVMQRNAEGIKNPFGTLPPTPEEYYGDLQVNDVTPEQAEQIISDMGLEEDAVTSELPQTAWEAAKYGTGPQSTIGSAATYAAGLLGSEMPQQPFIESRQVLKLAEQELTNALRQNPRFSEGERQAIERQISGILSPKIFRSPNVLYRELRLLDQQIRGRIAKAERDAANPNLTPEERKAQLDISSAMKRFIQTLGVPQKEDAPIQDDVDINTLLEMYGE